LLLRLVGRVPRQPEKREYAGRAELAAKSGPGKGRKAAGESPPSKGKDDGSSTAHVVDVPPSSKRSEGRPAKAITETGDWSRHGDCPV